MPKRTDLGMRNKQGWLLWTTTRYKDSLPELKARAKRQTRATKVKVTPTTETNRGKRQIVGYKVWVK